MKLITIISHVITLSLFAVFGFFIIFFFKNIIEKADQKISSYSNTEIENYCANKPIVEKMVLAAPPPPPPPPPPPEVDEPFPVVEEMPRFPGCEDLESIAERRQCSQQKMLKYIYSEIKYPETARAQAIEGTIVVRFYVNEQGTIKSPEILKGIGSGFDEEALRVVKSMNKLPEKWIPGRQRGKAVKVYYNLPIKILLK